MIHRDDLHGKERRAGQQPQIGHRNGEPARNAQKIHARNRDRHRQPDAKRRFFLGKYGRKRHQHDVKRSDKSRLPRLCPLRKTKLLRIRGRKECRAADKAAQQNILPCAAIFPEKAHRQQTQKGNEEAQRVDGKRAEILAADALRRKGRAPDHSGQKREHGLS